MARLATVFLVGGVLLATVAALALRVQVPKGFLLYTPGPGVPANPTPSSAIGFAVMMAALAAAALVFSAITYILASRVNRQWMNISKAAAVSALGFVLLLVVTGLTETQWP